MTGRIRIGIVGGGLAGITLAIALSKHRHVDVHVYEASPQFTKRGAGIGLSPLALEALDDVIPSAIDLLKTEAGAVEANAARLVIVCSDRSLVTPRPVLSNKMLVTMFIARY